MSKKIVPPLPVKKVPPPLPPKITAPSPTAAKAPTKRFKVESWQGDVEGEKIILYGRYGMGKTTLASMAPTPVFIGLDDGGRKIKHPKTRENLNHIPGIETFQDVRDVLHQHDLFNDYKTIVIDTGTQLQHLGLEHVFATIRGPKDHIKCTNIEQYGYHKGYRHLYDVMHHILGDLDSLVKQGKHVIIVCQKAQAKISNTGGEDFLCDTPDLQTDPKANIAANYMSWADHIFMIDHHNIITEDKKATAVGGRVVRVHSEIHFEAKSRSLSPEYAIVSFENEQDDSIWRILFGVE